VHRLQDVTNLDKFSGVLLKGQYFSRNALAKPASDTAVVYATAAPTAFPNSNAEPSHAD
jgi:hypothetical protein